VFDARATVVAGMFSILLWAGCSPLVATIGVEDGEPDHDADAVVWVEPSDAAPSMGEGGSDAAALGMPVRDGGGAHPSDAEVTPPPSCVVLPDLASITARTDGGVRSLDTGVVWAATDQELGCPMPVANAITYGRVDGRPLVTAGRPSALRWPGTSSMGTAPMTMTNRPCGEPLDFPFRFAIVLASFADCAQPPAGQYLRVNLSAPSLFPSGLMLCDESVCP
jgi:hypothetical protein